MIVAKNIDNYCIAYIPRLDLRPLTNKLGGRLDYDQPFCFFHCSCRLMSKALISLRPLHACSSLSPQRC